MLDYLRQRSQSAIIIFFVAIISAVFIINFGPQSQGCSTRQGAVRLAEVYGSDLMLSDFRWVERLVRRRYKLPRDYLQGPRFVEDVIGGLIDRELLVHAAKGAGLAVGEEDVRRAVVEKNLIHFSWAVDSPLPLRGPMVSNFRDEDGRFDSELFEENFLRSLQLSEKAFTEHQIQEILAERMRQLLESSVEVAEEEIWSEYARKADRVNIDYVRIYPNFFAQSLHPSNAELEAWAEEHSKQIEKQYEADRFRYRNVRKQLRVLDIQVRLSEDAEDEETAAQTRRAEAILELAKAPDADFGLLARCFSDDRQGVALSGDLGYIRKGMSRFGREFDEALFELEPGQISEVISTKRGLHIVQVLDAREGDIEIEQARLEIAEKIYRGEEGNARAQEVASALLKKARDGATLDDSILAGIPELEPEQCPALPGIEVPEGAEEEPPRRRALAPVVRESGFFNRSGLGVPGISDSAQLMTEAFELTEESSVPDEVITARDDLFVIRLADGGRQAPGRDEFEEQRESLYRRLIRRKRREALQVFLRTLRRQAEADGAISRNEPEIRRLSRTEEEEEEGADEEEGASGEEGEAAGESNE